MDYIEYLKKKHVSITHDIEQLEKKRDKIKQLLINYGAITDSDSDSDSKSIDTIENIELI